MLKFIRKYQLFILAIGGSLLMVVFLLQPVLQRISPSPEKAKVATLNHGPKITRGDLTMADFELSLLSRMDGRIDAPWIQGGLGLETDDTKRPLHWILLTREAQEAGLVGDALDGHAYLTKLAQQQAAIIVQQEAMQGNFTTQEEAQQRLSEYTSMLAAQHNRNVLSAAGAAPGFTEDDAYRILAKAQGVLRMREFYFRTPAYSDLGAVRAAHEAYDAVAVNAALIDASILADIIPDPTEEQLQTFFDEYKDKFRADTDFAVGYQQPTRIHLAYLKLDRQRLTVLVKVDRVELVKIKKNNPDLYPGDFASERAKIERKYREDKANEIMIEADRVIRALVLQSTRGLPDNDGRLTLPDDWEQRRPKLETLATAVTEAAQQQFDLAIPTPEISIYANAWVDASELSAAPGFGAASYRVGNQQFPAYAIPAVLTPDNPNASKFIIQPGLPLADPPATDEEGNRYYAVVLDVNPAGPADSIDDAGRERVINDYKQIRAYEKLAEHTDELRQAIASTGEVNAAIDAAVALAIDPPTTTPQVLRNILVRKDAVERGRLTPAVNPGLNAQPFRDAVLNAAASLDPLTNPSDIDNATRAVAVPLPKARTLAVASIVAPRPMTTEQFRARAAEVIRTQTVHDLMDANDPENPAYPFTYDALADRFGLQVLDKGKPTDTPS